MWQGELIDGADKKNDNSIIGGSVSTHLYAIFLQCLDCLKVKVNRFPNGMCWLYQQTVWSAYSYSGLFILSRLFFKLSKGHFPQRYFGIEWLHQCYGMTANFPNLIADIIYLERVQYLAKRPLPRDSPIFKDEINLSPSEFFLHVDGLPIYKCDTTVEAHGWMTVWRFWSHDLFAVDMKMPPPFYVRLISHELVIQMAPSS